VRPEVVAFRELDALVRNLSDQLADYRRRALSAESRAKELQLVADAFDAQLGDLRTDVVLACAARDAANADAMESVMREIALKDAMVQVVLSRDAAESMLTKRRTADEASAAIAAATALGDESPAEMALLQENARLRARLTDARDCTARMIERVRFLRQQMTTGTER